MIRRCFGTGLAVLVVAALLSAVGGSSVASASTPESFLGSATAQGLKLDLFGTNLTIGSTTAEADTTPQAQASGSGVALITATSSTALANTATPTVPALSGNGACGLSLPISGILNAALACSNSTATIAGSAPTALSTAGIADLDVSGLGLLTNLLQPVINALEGLGNQILGTVLTTVQNIVQPVLGNTLTNLLGGLGISTTQPVTSLVTALQRATGLLSVHVGDSTSSVVTSASAVTASSAAEGATITVLPGLLLNGDPLLSITVGKAQTSSTYDRTSGTSTANFTPAILSIDLLGNTISIPGTSLTLLAGTPLASTITIGGGSTTKNANGSVTATADAVGLDLLQGISGGIDLDLAHAESVAGGALAVANAATTTTTTPVVHVEATTVTPLATTGTDAPLLPVGFALLLAGYLTRRKLLARRNRSSR